MKFWWCTWLLTYWFFLGKDFSDLQPQLNLTISSNVSNKAASADTSNGHLIPIYCSVLALVILCLLAYVVFKRRQIQRQKKERTQKEAEACIEENDNPEARRLTDDEIHVVEPSDRPSVPNSISWNCRKYCSSKTKHFRCVWLLRMRLA